MVVDTRRRAGARRDLVRLVHQRRGVREFSREVTRILNGAVRFEGACLLMLDPATLLPTGHFVENGLSDEAMVRLQEIELQEPDVNKFTALARAAQPAASLSEATEGDLDRSLRQHELRRPSGFDDELRAALSGPMGTWGALTLMRETRRPYFTPEDVRFVASLSSLLADGLRRAALADDAAPPRRGNDPGLLVLFPDNTVELANAAAEAWLDELAEADEPRQRLPVVVRSVAVRAQEAAHDGLAGDLPARARVRTSAGRWVVAHGSVLGTGQARRVAVSLEEVRPPELAPLIADGYGFTARERVITELVAQGLATSDIAMRLHLSPYTVQDHLKSIFEKSGASSRGDLVARIFFGHFAPELGATNDP